MAENLLCQEANCCEPAHSFRFIGTEKRQICEKHTTTLLSQDILIYDIAAFAFIQTPQDGPVYDARIKQMRQGLDNLDVLETACKRKWEKQEDGRGTSERAQEKHRLKRYQKLLIAIENTRKCIARLIQEKDSKLNPEDIMFCRLAPKGPLFSLVMRGCPLSVAGKLMMCFLLLGLELHLETEEWTVKLQELCAKQEKNGSRNLLTQAVECARLLTATDSDNECGDLAKRLRGLFGRLAINAAEECLQTAQKAVKSGEFAKGLMELQRGTTLLADIDHSQLSIQLRICLAEIYSQTDCWESTAICCAEIYTNSAHTPHHFLLLQALFYFTKALHRLGLHRQGYVLEDKWGDKLTAATPRSRQVLLCIQAYSFEQQGQNEEAASLYEEAL